MAVNLRELMQKPTDSYERPKELPAGHYYGTIGTPEWGKSPKQKTDFLRFPIKLEGPGEDVDPEAVKGVNWDRPGRFGRDGARADFYITPDAIYRLGDFLDAVLGKESGRSADERYPDTRGARVLVQVTTRPSNDNPEDVYNDVGKVVAA